MLFTSNQIGVIAEALRLQSGHLGTKPWTFERQGRGGFVYRRGGQRISISAAQVVQAWTDGLIRMPATRPAGIPRLFMAVDSR